MKSYIKKHVMKILGAKYRRYASNFLGIFNIFSVVYNFLKLCSYSKKRILVVYDLSAQPFSVGDFLLAQEAGLILCSENKGDMVDVAIILDPAKPKSNDPAFESINSKNYLYNFSAIFPILQFNKKLGSIFVFNDATQLIKLLKNRKSYITVWPSVKNIFLTRRYLHYLAFDEVIFPNWKKFRKLPDLEPIDYLRDWAEFFIKKFCNGKVVITVNFRNNKSFQTERNLDIDIWYQFFCDCKAKKNIIFVVVCARNEIDDRLRSCPNVIFSKDHDTTIEQDLALIAIGDIHMGSSSGPATVAWFTQNKPYFIVRFTLSPSDFETSCLIETDTKGYYRYIFSTQFQTFYSGKETLNMLILKLQEMLVVVEPKKRISKSGNDKIQNWLR